MDEISDDDRPWEWLGGSEEDYRRGVARAMQQLLGEMALQRVEKFDRMLQSFNGGVVPLGLVVAGERAAELSATLREVAQMMGEVRPCRICGKELAVFQRKK